MALGIADQLVHTTVRIETRGPGGTGSGTGSFVHLCNSNGRHLPLIVTNQHVIEGATDGFLHFTQAKPGGGEPDIGKHVPAHVTDFQNQWIKHPTADLAAFPLGPLLTLLREQGHAPFYASVDPSVFADADFLSQLTAVEDIAMVGYPIGLWDSRNNLPIVRRGITATLPYVDFEGRPEFLIDCACFPGSSGSPVFLLNLGSYVDKEGNTNLAQSRVKLLGVLWGGPQFTATGEVKAVPVPTNHQPVVLSKIPANLGYCIKADQILWFERHFQPVLDQATQQNPASS
jgi:hypothetical protein